MRSVSPQAAVGAFTPSRSNLCATVVGVLLLFAFIYWLFSPPAQGSGYAMQLPQGQWRAAQQAQQGGLFGAAAAQPHMIPHPAEGTAARGAMRDVAQPPARRASGSRTARPGMTEMTLSSEGDAASSPLSRSLQSPHLEDVEAEWFEGRRAWAVA